MEQENLSFWDSHRAGGVKRVLQAAETVRGRVSVQNTGADCLVVVMRLL
jgi:hypothetical protein